MIQWIWEEHFECKNQDEITKMSLERVVLVLIKKKRKKDSGVNKFAMSKCEYPNLDMVNLFTNKKLPKRIAVIYKDLTNVTSKLHCTVGSIGFIKKALYHEIIPKFALVNGN